MLADQSKRLKSDADALMKSVRDALGVPAVAVTATFADDGRPLQLNIDQELRSKLTEEQLCTQIVLALVVGQYPRAVLESFAQAAEQRQSDAGSSRVREEETFVSRDRAFTLTARSGKATRFRARSGSLMWLSPQEISAQVIDLTTQAWTSESRRAS
jgi:hypothetical protein